MKFVQRLGIVFRVLMILQICLAVQPFGNSVMAADGDVLWEQVFGAAFFDAASQVLVNENQLVIGGETHLPGDSIYPNFTEFLVAHDINTGGRLWSTTIGHDGPFSDFIGGLAIIGCFRCRLKGQASR